MIDNFVPQPYPLECSTDGSTWHLVLGWAQLGSGTAPVVAPADGPAFAQSGSVLDALRFRQAAPPTTTLRPSSTAAAPRAVAPPAVSARRDRDSA